jgi:hypothetical protein
VELYNLETDPFELRNLATDPAYAAVLTDLRLELHTRVIRAMGLDEH